MYAFGLAGGVDGVEEDKFLFFCCCGFFAAFFVFEVRGVAFDAVARCCGRSIEAGEAGLTSLAVARLERCHGSCSKSLGRSFLVSFLVQREDGILLVLCRAGFLAQLGSTEETTGVAFAEVGSLAGTQGVGARALVHGGLEAGEAAELHFALERGWEVGEGGSG